MAERPDAYIGLRRFLLEGGWQVFVGRTDEDNDILTLKIAAPRDLWFHVKGMPGSHVILHHPVKTDPVPALVKQAAAIAAYYSKFRKGGIVPVICAEARHVSKPDRAKPGTVHVRKERIIKVRPGLPEDHPAGNGS